MIIARLIFVFAILSFPFAHAEQWVSPIDKKYSEQNSALFSKFDQARKSLDAWRGRQENARKASRLLKQVLKKDPNFAPVHREYARLYLIAGYKGHANDSEVTLDAAEQAILAALALEPDYAECYVLLGHLYTTGDELEKAKNALGKAEQIGTRDPWLRLNRAEILKREGSYEDALALYLEAVAVKSANAKAQASSLGGVALMYRVLGRLDDAVQAYEAKIAFEPDNAWSWGNYASFLLFRLGRVSDAELAARKALELMNYGAARSTLACVLYTQWATLVREGKSGDAVDKYLREAEALDPRIDRVISRTRKYKSTLKTAVELEGLQERRLLEQEAI